MKKVLFTALVLAGSCYVASSQARINKNELSILKKNIETVKLLTDTDADFNTSNTAAKWSSESAVILCQKTNFEFDKKGVSAGRIIGRNVMGVLFALPTLGASLLFANTSNETKILVEETERRKILLNDKFAVDLYSILYFRLHNEGDVFNARVIKKDGSVEKVDFADAVRVDDLGTVPGLFKSYTERKFSSTYRPTYFKLAVSDLEPGDVVEYEFKHINSERYSSNPEYKEFDPVYYLCNRELPVAKQVIEVVAQDDRYFIAYKSLKGAPEFVQTNTNGQRIYRWVDGNRDKRTDTRYVNEYLQLPSIKFQMIYARNSSKNFVWFKDEAAMKQDLTEEQLAEKVKVFLYHPDKMNGMGYMFAGLGSSTDKAAKAIYKEMKKKGLHEAADDEFVRKAYYTIRHQTLYNNWSDYAFAKVFSAVLNERKLDHDILVTGYNSYTDLNKIAFTKELAWFIKYKNKYYCNPDEHLNPEELPIYLAGNKALRFHYGDETKAMTHEVLPLPDTLENVVNITLKASMDVANASNIVIHKTTEAKGMAKFDYLDDALAMTPFMENDYKNYDGEGMWEGLDSKSEQKATEEFNHKKKEWKEEKPLMMKALASSEYQRSVDKYDNFRLVQDGRSYKKKELKFEEAFTLADVKSSAGDDILLEVPMLIGSQVRLKKEERTRTLPVDIRYPRTINYQVTFAIPAGYTVKGIEALNNTISNECGAFISSAKIENNNLVLNVKKMYRLKAFDTNKWSELLSVQDAAYTFSQSKILLQKI